MRPLLNIAYRCVRARHIASLICAWPALGFVGFATQRTTTPVVTSEIIVDYVAPPRTLEEAVQASAAIVVAVAQTERTYQPPIDGASMRLIYRMNVLEVLQTHQALPSGDVEVYRMGGDTDRGDHIIRSVERDFPGFLSGRTYLLLLSWNRVLQAFEPRFGPNGVFELFPDGRIDTPGRAPFARAQTTKIAATLLADIKQAVLNR
jgi:hypothetical protein